MKKIYKVLSAFALVGVSIAGLASCQSKTTPSSTGDTAASSTPNTTGGATENLIDYSIRVQSISSMPIANAYVALQGRTQNYEGYTDENGVATISAPKSTYVVDVPDFEGYTISEEYQNLQVNSEEELLIKLKPQLITEDVAAMPDNIRYKEYDQMYDYTFKGYDFGSETSGEYVEWKLSDLLEDNNLVVLNFWYTTCSWCVREFPYLVKSYEKYMDQGVKVIGINPGAQYNDDVDKVKSFAADQKLNIMSTVGDTTLVSAFGITGFPTSVFIDRYGTITVVENGAITTQEKWDGLFSKYISDNYVPTYESSGSNVKPDVEFPGSEPLEKAALANGVEATFRAETRDGYEYSWPWVVSDDGNSIHPTNKGINSSYAIAWMDITVPANKVLALDYKASSEDGDILGIFLDGKRLCQMAGKDDTFKTQYLYVAGNSDEKISIEFFFYKDSKTAMWDDTVYVNNVRFLDQSELQTKFQVIRQAAYGGINPFTSQWTNYITPVYNENDGYYHVGDENGPLLLAALNDENTHFSNKSIVTLLAENPNSFVDSVTGKDYGAIISQYSSYADNSSVTMLDLPTNGLTSITKELAEALQFVAREFGDDSLKDFENQWLEMCVYISEYNTPEDQKIGDPIKGLATFSAIESGINYGDDKEPVYNYIKYDFPLVPRGYLFSITPERSGVYHLYGESGQSTEAFFYGGSRQDDSKAYVDRQVFINLDKNVEYADDFTQYMYYEAGKTYYIAPCFFDVDDTEHILKFRIDYVGESYKYLAQASEGTFTYEQTSTGAVGNIISISNIKVVLGTDNYYHPADENGNPIMNEFIYADFKYTTGVFSGNTLEEIIAKGGFDFSKTELGDGSSGVDETETAKSYLVQAETDENSYLYGTVKVDNGLQSLLQKLMDKYTFKDVSGSWLKVCYFSVELGNK